MKLENYIPKQAEIGASLVLRDTIGRYVFFVAGTKHSCPKGKLFYAGIGGHLEQGESLLECIKRETKEEIGVEISPISSQKTWLVKRDESISEVDLDEEPRPYAIYAMFHPPYTPKEGYYIVIYEGKIPNLNLKLDSEVISALIALPQEQIKERQRRVKELIKKGASILAGNIKEDIYLYPFGTALALVSIFSQY